MNTEELLDYDDLGNALREGRALDAQRMAHAAQQLESGLPLAQIAEDCGYESERVFARAFKRWCGLPPRAYQRSAQALRKEFAALK